MVFVSSRNTAPVSIILFELIVVVVVVIDDDSVVRLFASGRLSSCRLGRQVAIFLVSKTQRALIYSNLGLSFHCDCHKNNTVVMIQGCGDGGNSLTYSLTNRVWLLPGGGSGDGRACSSSSSSSSSS
jgi:hypothetical protein